MRHRSCLIAILAGLIACADSPTQPAILEAPPPDLRAEVVTVFQGWFPLNPPPPSVVGCFGEAVQLTGEYNLVVRSVTSNRGKSVFLIQVAAHGTGIGLATGTRYEVNEFTHATFHGAGTQTLIFRINFISHGGIPNLAGWIQLHLTIDANGRVTAYREDVAFDVCRGRV